MLKVREQIFHLVKWTRTQHGRCLILLLRPSLSSSPTRMDKRLLKAEIGIYLNSVCHTYAHTPVVFGCLREVLVYRIEKLAPSKEQF